MWSGALPFQMDGRIVRDDGAGPGAFKEREVASAFRE